MEERKRKEPTIKNQHLNTFFMFFNFFQDADNYEQRKVARTEVNGLQVSTAYTSDMGYETAILDAEGAHPVERYGSREDAIKGHEKWLEIAKTAETVVKLGWGGWTDDEEITLIRANS
jgi:hypothetical protein